MMTWLMPVAMTLVLALQVSGAGAEELALGSPAPDFRLRDVVSGRLVARDDVAEQEALLVVFLCRHCPYVQHVKGVLAEIGRDYADRVGIIGISANDPADYPEDAPESLKEMALQEGFVFPVVFDETQAVAKAYGAVATPEPFLFDRQRRLVYRGQLDETRPRGRREATGADLRAALDAVLAGHPVPADQKPAVGCSITWKER